jgi:peptidyl-Asp metalloendopeptidase
MRARVAAIALFSLLAGWSSDWDPARAGDAGARSLAGSAGSATTPVAITPAKGDQTPFASLPGHGNLLAYDRARPVKQSGPYTWHPVDLSEARALRAVVDGEMVVMSPDGRPIRLHYERHVEHANGNWTWFGRDRHGADAVLTFGEKAVFGSIPDGDREALQLTVADGRSWLVHTDVQSLPALDTSRPDYLVPPDLSHAIVSRSIVAAGLGAESLNAQASTTVDVLLGYTSGFATALGGQSQAVTRLTNLVDITNQAYVNSGMSQRIRLVHAMEVQYPDATDNSDTLQKLSGYKSGVGAIAVDPAFNALRAARDQYGADLVSLVRKFQAPQNNGCGIAWLIGGEQSPIGASAAPFGYSVVSDGTDRDETDNLTYGCRSETLAHEFGHNMGQAHNVADSSTTGAHAYSYGYREDSSSGFYTVMAYRLANSSQTAIRYFANPSVSYRDRPTGMVDVADNVRSLNQTMPRIATFRDTITRELVTPSLYAISKMGGSARTEVHTLNGANGYQSYTANLAIALGQTGNSPSWQFAFNDFNGDGLADLYAIARQASSGRTEVIVFDGARQFNAALWHVATVLPVTGMGLEWEFLLGDYNRDGTADLYLVYRIGASNRTELHVLNGADGFQSYLAHIATGLAQTGVDNLWHFELGDYNADNVLDLYCIYREGASDRTEVHILDGAGNFQGFALNVATALHRTGGGNDWDFKLGDYNKDGIVDVYAIAKMGSSGRTEIHVLDGASRYGQFSANIATVLPASGTDYAWDFELTH